jgi:murein DD-endopeptidase MepM/ murein hydrolase activator NlpD
MKQYLLIYIVLLIQITVFPQNLKLVGELKPGNILVGIGDNIEQVKLDDNLLQVDYRGFFLFGFDRDAKGTHYLRIKYLDGKSEIQKLELPIRKYKIQKIDDMDQKLVTPPDYELDGIANERKIIKKARKEIGKIDSALYNPGFTIPVKGGRITGVFGSQRILNGIKKSPHNGLDIAAPEATSVYAMTDGIVRLTGENYYYNGNFVFIDHGQGLSSMYLHMSKLNVKDGQEVKKGNKIGEVGTTGRSTGPHLHWSVQWYNKRIDPACLLGIKFNN